MRRRGPIGPRRRLLARNDGTCPGEVSKSWRLARLVDETVQQQGLHVDFLDLSRVTSEYDLNIHPCKGCVSTAMPLCHWPCSCYPNHALGQSNDWMAEIHERFVDAHGGHRPSRRVYSDEPFGRLRDGASTCSARTDS